MEKLNADIALKNYWSNNERFADLFNQVFFEGEEMIKAKNLTVADTNESSMYADKLGLDSVTRFRDVMKQYGKDVDFVLIGIESQLKVHYGMPVRTMLYDALGYTNQCKEIENHHLEAKDLSGSSEFLSRMKKEDRIKMVLTLVIYYGEKPWDGAERLSDMMNIPPGFERFLNNHTIHLLQMGKTEGIQFKNKDNDIFFTVINEFYRTGSIDINHFKEKFPNLMVYWETLVAIGATTCSQELIDYAQEKKGDINMCTALDNLVKQGIEEGMQKGMQQGICISIKMLRDNGVKEESIIDSVMENYKISYDEVKELLEK